MAIKRYFLSKDNTITNAFKENPDPLEFFRDIRNNFFNSIDEFYEKFFNYCFEKFPQTLSLEESITLSMYAQLC